MNVSLLHREDTLLQPRKPRARTYSVEVSAVTFALLASILGVGISSLFVLKPILANTETLLFVRAILTDVRVMTLLSLCVALYAVSHHRFYALRVIVSLGSAAIALRICFPIVPLLGGVLLYTSVGWVVWRECRRSPLRQLVAGMLALILTIVVVA